MKVNTVSQSNPEVDSVNETKEANFKVFKKLGKNTKAALALLGVGALATLSSKTGFTEHLKPTELKEIANSLRHPLLGYIGAWAIDRLPVESRAGRQVTRLLGATAVNFAAEGGQTAILSTDLAPWSSENPDFTADENRIETLKDFGFAGLGALSYMAVNKKADS